MDSATRRAIGMSTAAALAGLGYVNAGTVEFLREPSGNLYFMEMNTRLQVEHPVTEEVTGIDIVKEQIRIAANERLSIAQNQIQIKGHALEFRLNAEDPDAGFRPSPGTITRFTAPVGAKGVRLETHLNATADGAGDPAPYDVPPWYDSLIAKMIVSAPDRAGAIAAAVRALEATRIEGIKTTLPLHLRVLKDPTFLSGAYDVTILSSIMQGV
jgi:acetyl-CoA carboxylase biotin carboxylase subunit